MTRKLVFILILFLIVKTSEAQTEDAIIGKWKFREIYQAEKIDSVILKSLRQVFADVSIYLKPNHRYKLVMMREDEGSWTFDDQTKKLIMSANTGTESNFDIVSVTENELVLGLGKGKAFILERTVAEKIDETEEAISSMELVSATSKQICKKWYICKREVPDSKPEITSIATDLASEAYFQFNMDGSYESEIFKIKTRGKWQFGQEFKVLILLADGAKVFWKIRAVSENELVLVRGNTYEIWTLCTKR